MNHIICTDLTKEFRKGGQVIRPLEKLSLTVPRGEFLALMGPSGSGKTTLLNMISGIDTPSSGSLIVDGKELTGMSPGQLAEGQQVRISCDVFPQREFSGRVARIYGRADQTRNTIRCQVSIENPDNMLRPDMQCRGAFYSEGVITRESAAEGERDAAKGDPVRVPESAIRGDAVWVVSPEGVLKRRQIVRMGDKVRGVLPGEPVLLHPAADLEEGQRVNISE